MPLQSTLASATCVFEQCYLLPTEDQLKEFFGSTPEGDVNYTQVSEATFEMTVSLNYALQPPPKNYLDPEVLNSTAYTVFSNNFYELIKNSIDSHATEFLLTIFTDVRTNKIEVVVADNGGGFLNSKYANLFESATTLVKFHDLIKKQEK